MSPVWWVGRSAPAEATYPRFKCEIDRGAIEGSVGSKGHRLWQARSKLLLTTFGPKQKSTDPPTIRPSTSARSRRTPLLAPSRRHTVGK